MTPSFPAYWFTPGTSLKRGLGFRRAPRSIAFVEKRVATTRLSSSKSEEMNGLWHGLLGWDFGNQILFLIRVIREIRG